MGDGDSTPTPLESEEVWHVRKNLMVVVLCLVVLGLIGMGVTATYVLEQRAYNDCQRGANEDFAAALRERSDAGALDRSAVRLMARSGSTAMGVVLDPASSQPQRVAAIQQWQRDQAAAERMLGEADDARAEHPLNLPRRC